MSGCTLTPAYGKDYKSKKAALKDLLANKDFILNDPLSRWDGKPANLEAILDSGYGRITVRYRNRTQAAVFTANELKRQLPVAEA